MIKILFYLKKQRLLVFLSLVLLISSSSFIMEEPRVPDKANRKTAGKHTGKMLSPEEYFRRRERYRRVGDESRPDRQNIQWCRENPKFRETPGPRVGIVSFPGSGNTWVRYLLQQMTGILTGSVYEDGDLKRNGFKGETHRDGKVLVVKTHEWGPIVRSGIRSTGNKV